MATVTIGSPARNQRGRDPQVMREPLEGSDQTNVDSDVWLVCGVAPYCVLILSLESPRSNPAGCSFYPWRVLEPIPLRA